jgi:virginiamycin B lyase
MRRWCLPITLALLGGVHPPAAPEPEVVIREWDVPTPNSRPHDPCFAPDGALWYTGQTADTLGRVETATGQIKEYRLRSGSGPHGLIADRDGKIWYTANSAGYIGKLDPETGQVVEYPMPDSRARDPHTPIFDQAGILWFTVQGGNFVGRIDPRTGEVRLRQPPTAGARPYGMVVDSSGAPFFCENGSNKIGRIDPATMAITEFTLTAVAQPRRLAVTADDIIYYTSDRGHLGRLDPRTGAVEEILSPGGSGAGPYAIAATPDGYVWYTETALQPNMLVRFDTRTKQFDRWPVPSGGGVVRHMVATPERNLYLACSGVNKVGVAYLANTRGFTIPEQGGVAWSSPGAAGPPLSGYARVDPGVAATTLAGLATFSLRQGDTLVSEATVPAARVLRGGRIHAEVAGAVKTGLALANPNDVQASVSFYFTDEAGRASATRTASIAAGGQIAAFLDGAPFEGGSPLGGTLTFSSSVPIAAAALRGLTNERSEFLMTTLPVVDSATLPDEGAVFPHFADGGGWTTQLVLVNGGDSPAAGNVRFFSQGSAAEPGQALVLAVDGRTDSSFAYSIAPGSAARMTTSGAGSGTIAGSVRVAPSPGSRTPTGLAVLSFRRGGVTVAEAGVPAVRAGRSFRLYGEATAEFGAAHAGSLQTGVAVANLSGDAAAVDFALTTLGGAAAGAARVTVPGNGQTALFLGQLAGLGPFTTAFQGVLRVSTGSAAGIAVTALRGRYNERGDFLISATPAVAESEPPSAGELVFPHLVDGGGYTTLFALFGGGAGAAPSGLVRFFGQAGRPLALWPR